MKTRLLLTTVLAIVNSSSAFVFTACQRLSFHVLDASAPSSTDVDDGLSNPRRDDEHFTLNNEGLVISKSKWKKKRFLMLKDVNAAIQKQNSRATRKAEEVVRRMWQLYELTNDDDFKPDLQVYNLWIHALAKSKSKTSGKSAEDVLHEMKKRGIAPNVISFTSVMDAYANQARFDAKAPEQAERVLFDLIEKSEYDHSLVLTSVTADVALKAWAQGGTRQGALRAQQILDRLEGLQTSLRPTAYSYSTVIHGWAQSKSGVEAAQRSERILKRLLRGDDAYPKPDTVVFNAVIDAWSSSGDPRAGTKALGLLNKMKDLSNSAGYDCQPDVVSYNTVLSAWSHSGHINAANKGEQIIQMMIDDHRNDPDSCPAPNTVSFNNLLHAWSRSKSEAAVQRVEGILKYMTQSDDENIAPDAYSFTSVLNTIAKSKAPNKAERAREHLETMLRLHAETKKSVLKPTQVPFNAVLNAAAFSALGTPKEEQRMALKIAVETFALMKKLSIYPDTVSYGNMLKVFANLMPKGATRNEMGLQLFAGSCQDGLVGDLVWNEARRVLPSKVLSDMIPSRKAVSALRANDLPIEWRKNLPQERRQNAKKSNAKATKQKIDPVEQKRREPLRRFRNISEPSYQSGRDV